MSDLKQRLGFKLCLRARTGFSLTDASNKRRLAINIRMPQPDEINKGVLNGLFDIGMVPRLRGSLGFLPHVV